MKNQNIYSVKEVFIDVCRRTRTKEIAHELYYISYNSMCGLYVHKLSKRSGLDEELLNTIYEECHIGWGSYYLPFTKLGTEWKVNEILGDTDHVSKAELIEKYK